MLSWYLPEISRYAAIESFLPILGIWDGKANGLLGFEIDTKSARPSPGFSTPKGVLFSLGLPSLTV